MEKNLFTFLILILSIVCISQNRADDKLPIISKDVKGQILNANGWKKNQYGKWVTAKNKIPFDIEQEYKSLQNYEYYSLGDNEQNFISYQLYDVKIKDTIYSLLIEKYRDGYYTYESIREGWNNRNSYRFYVFDKSELNKFKTIINDSVNIIEIKILYSDDKKYLDLAKINNAVISNEINASIKDKSILSTDQLFITIRKFKPKNIVQFFISTNFYDFEENMYYETDYTTFNNFLKLE